MARLSPTLRGDDVFRICVGRHHQPDCSHQEYMRTGVEDFLADVETRKALVYAVGEEKAAYVLGVLAWRARRVQDDER